MYIIILHRALRFKVKLLKKSPNQWEVLWLFIKWEVLWLSTHFLLYLRGDQVPPYECTANAGKVHVDAIYTAS